MRAVAACLLWPAFLLAGERGMDLPLTQETGWRFFSDQVMGGVSQGQADLRDGLLHLTGRVSTANRGGFIQAQAVLRDPLPVETRGIVLSIRGNDQPYFVHLRTRGMMLPWQYYQAEFFAGSEWREVRLPFEAFKPSGSLLRKVPKASDVESIGIVAYGRDHDADVWVKAVGFY